MSALMVSVQSAGLAVVVAAAMVLSACGAKSGQALVDDGKAAYDKKDYKTAIVQFKSALQKEPGSAELRLMLGDSLLSTGDAPGAAVELGKAIEQGADPEKALPLLASALLGSGDAKRLVQNYANTALKDKNAQASLKLSLSAAWDAVGDHGKAASELEAAIAAAPDYPPVAMMRVRQLAASGKPDAALKAIDGVLEKNAGRADAWVLKGELLAMDPRNSDAAESAFRKAVELDNKNAAAHFSLINLRLRLNDLAGARKEAAAQKEALPRHPLTAYVDAQLALVGGDIVRARETVQKLMNQAPNNVNVLQLAGAIAARSRELIQAEAHYSKALQIAPQSLTARRDLARVYLQLAQPRRALETLHLLVETASDDSESLALAGDAQLALGDTAAAETLFLRAAKIAPDDARVKTSLALTHLARGDAETAFGELANVAAASPSILAEQAAFAARLRRREFDAALALVDQMAKKVPQDLAQYELRGRVFLARKDFVQARKAFEAELAADPKLFAATASLAALDLVERKPEAARKRLQASVAADPKNFYAIMSLAELQSSTGAPLDEVKALLNQAIKAAPQQAEPRLQLIGLTLRKRLFKDALVAAQEASAAMPNDMTVMDAVGRAQMEAGDVEQAISTFRKMAGASAASGMPYMRLADIYKVTGKRDQAESVLRKALEVEPGLVAAQTSLVELLFTTKRQAEALEFIKREQRNSPSGPVGYGMEALYHLRNKAPDAAVAAYRTGIAKTKSKQLAVSLHRVLTRMGQRQEADQFAAAWMKEHPEDLVFAYQVAEAAIGRSQFDEAEKRLARLQGLEPNNSLVLNNLASVIMQQGKAGALPYAQKAADLAPDNSSILDTLASALAFEKQFDKALSTQKRAVELAPEANTLRLNLAGIALKAGDKTLARTELTRLQALGAKFKQQDEVSRLLKAS